MQFSFKFQTVKKFYFMQTSLLSRATVHWNCTAVSEKPCGHREGFAQCVSCHLAFEMVNHRILCWLYLNYAFLVQHHSGLSPTVPHRAIIQSDKARRRAQVFISFHWRTTKMCTPSPAFLKIHLPGSHIFGSKLSWSMHHEKLYKY